MQQKLSQEQIAQLKAPLPADAVKPHPTKNYLSSIKAIYVVERLNEVFGIGGWFVNNEVVREDGKMIVVKSTFQAPAYGIVIPDIFGGNDNADLGDAYKGACTDALTKIGSYLYIGMDVYKGQADKLQATEKQQSVKMKPAMTADQFAKTLDRYEKGEKDVFKKAADKFSFTDEQKQTIQQKMKAA